MYFRGLLFFGIEIFRVRKDMNGKFCYYLNLTSLQNCAGGFFLCALVCMWMKERMKTVENDFNKTKRKKKYLVWYILFTKKKKKTEGNVIKLSKHSN